MTVCAPLGIGGCADYGRRFACRLPPKFWAEAPLSMDRKAADGTLEKSGAACDRDSSLSLIWLKSGRRGPIKPCRLSKEFAAELRLAFDTNYATWQENK